MKRKKIAASILASLVLLSYCATIPVLSVVHWHHFRTSTHSTVFSTPENGRSAEENPLDCGMCARIASSVSFVTTLAVIPAVHPLYEASWSYCEPGFLCLRYIPCLDRAPPSTRTSC